MSKSEVAGPIEVQLMETLNGVTREEGLTRCLEILGRELDKTNAANAEVLKRQPIDTVEMRERDFLCVFVKSRLSEEAVDRLKTKINLLGIPLSQIVLFDEDVKIGTLRPYNPEHQIPGAGP